MDNSGQEVWRMQSDAFGRTAITSSGPVVRLRFPGQINYGYAGIYYNYYRDYDSNTGRYLESDPIGLSGGLNTYGYAFQNPVRYLDPTGEGPISATICVAALAINAASTYLTIRNLVDEIEEIYGEIQALSACEPQNSQESRDQLADLERLQQKGLRLGQENTKELLKGSLIETGILTICVPLSFILP
jgi:RHS repeat-associated protein